VPRTCTVCSHPARESIDSAIIRRAPYRDIARRFGVSKDSLSRHLNEHLAEYVQKALSEYGTGKSIRVLDRLGRTVERLDAFLDAAENNGDGAEFRANAAELRKQLELIAKLQGVLAQEGTTNIHLNAEWLRIEAVLVRALDRYPDAQDALVRALEEMPNARN
jgi:DNA-binding transcriptional ArsR family regulator